MLIVQICIVVLEGLFPGLVFTNLPHFWNDQAEVLREMQGSFLGVATPRCPHPQFLGITVLSGSTDDQILWNLARLTSWHCFRGPPSLSSAMSSPAFLLPHDLVLFWKEKTIWFEISQSKYLFNIFTSTHVRSLSRQKPKLSPILIFNIIAILSFKGEQW